MWDYSVGVKQGVSKEMLQPHMIGIIPTGVTWIATRGRVRRL